MAQPFSYTVRQLCYELGLHVNDAKLVTASALGTTAQFEAFELAGIADNGLVGTELWAWDRPAGDVTVGVQLPQVVTFSFQASGILLLNRAAFGVAYQIGNRAVLQNLMGRGYPQEKKEYALKMACMDLYDARATTVQAIATPSTTDFWNALPATLRSVFRVTQYVAASNQEKEIAPATWGDLLDPAGWRINLPFDWQAGDAVRVYGRIDPTAWWDTLRDGATGGVLLDAYTTVVPGDPRKIIQAALPWLLDAKRDPKAKDMTELAYQRRLREGLERAYPNEVWRQ